jgi:ribosomal protein S12 methylthiotransferase
VKRCDPNQTKTTDQDLAAKIAIACFPDSIILMTLTNILRADTKKLYLVSLGCARNLVDSEVMLGLLMKAGWTIIQDPKEAGTIIINTCSFIEPAINESIDTILELAEYKHKGVCERLIVTGCLPERFREEIVATLPEVDIFLGTGAFDRIVSAVNGSTNFPDCLLLDPNTTKLHAQDVLRVRSSAHMAYLKIAEGCNRHCTYCIIPKLRGKQRSRPVEDIILEAKSLVASGVKELILIAQDTTNYGKDLATTIDFSGLLEKIADISPDVWVRFLYGHPNSLSDTIIKTVMTRPNVCSYFDIPVQHSSGSVLKRMSRTYTPDDLYKLFNKVRSVDPDAALRTTLIVGFPGETSQDFEQLLAFVKNIRFDHLGAFIYSDSEDLPSHKLPRHVEDKIAKKRFDRLMSVQAEVSFANNQKHVGKTVTVIVEKQVRDDLFTGRTSFQAPEVDGITYIHSKQMQTGHFARVKITDALEYDLVGKAA